MRQEPIAYFIAMIFEIGFAFIIGASASAAFTLDSPYRSPFSDFINSIFRIFLDKPIPTLRVRWRVMGILFASVGGLAASGYLAQKHSPFYLPCIYYAAICVFALIRKGRERDMRPRLFNLPLWVLLSSLINFTNFTTISDYLIDRSKLWIVPFVLASILLWFQALVGIKMSETRPMTVEAEAVSWLLKTSSNVDPAWFQKAVQIAGQSPNARALLLEKLLPLLSPLITSLPGNGQGNVTPEQKGYINTLAILMDFEPQPSAFWRNQASLERPTLPKELIDRLKELKALGEKCSHKDNNRDDGRASCPEACVSDAVERILHKFNEKENPKSELESA